MKSPITYLTPLLLSFFTLTGCNVFSSLSSPSNDEQYLVAARACMDRGDFDCALENYKALSNSYGDVKVNETSLANLAKARVFSFSDLVSSLGSSLGSGSSFASMANAVAGHAAATAANRVLIQSTYTDNDAIGAPKLKAFSKFISALAMFNTVLASAVGPDGVLTASDLVDNPTACLAIGNVGCTGCDEPTGTALTFNFLDSTNLDASSGWDGSATIQKLIQAATKANTQASAFLGGGSSSGIFDALNQISTIANLPGANACTRQTLLNILGLH